MLISSVDRFPPILTTACCASSDELSTAISRRIKITGADRLTSSPNPKPNHAHPRPDSSPVLPRLPIRTPFSVSARHPRTENRSNPTTKRGRRRAEVFSFWVLCCRVWCWTGEIVGRRAALRSDGAREAGGRETFQARNGTSAVAASVLCLFCLIRLAVST
jgi:hypothetical protein